MYVNFYTQVIDTDEIKEIIEKESDYRVLRNLTKATKREDMVAYELGITVETIKSILEEDIDITGCSEDELFDEYLNMAEEMATDLSEFMPDDAYMDVRAYTIDEVDNTIKLIMALAPEELGELKLSDVMKRLLKQVG